MKKLIIIFAIILTSCSKEAPSLFSEKALNDSFLTLDKKAISFKEILNKYKGKKIVVDIWASWCGDCIKGMPKVAALQQKKPEVVFLFLSLDKNLDDWKLGIKKYQVKGEHYFLKSGWEGDFGSFVDIDWIPRYMVINEKGEIALFKAVEADDTKIINALN